MAKKKPWYADGLQFECTQCGACCSGEEGYVWVDDVEVDAMAEKLSMTEGEFRKKFVRRVGGRHSLVEYPDGDCILLDPKTRHCIVYEARPIQCRTWPFWNSNLTSERAWDDMCQQCPGAGKGRLYSLDEIEIERKKKRV